MEIVAFIDRVRGDGSFVHDGRLHRSVCWGCWGCWRYRQGVKESDFIKSSRPSDAVIALRYSAEVSKLVQMLVNDKIRV